MIGRISAGHMFGAVLFLAAAPAAAQVDCTDNLPPVLVCPDHIIVPAAPDACEWTFDSSFIDPAPVDPDGDEVTCTSDWTHRDGLSMLGVQIRCADPCGAEAAPCSTLIVLRDVTPAEIDIATPIAELDAVTGGATDWLPVEALCGIALADNCTPTWAILRGLIDIASSDVDEVIEGGPGAFQSAGILADWHHVALNLDIGNAADKTYDLTFGTLDAYGNSSEATCRIRIVGDAPPVERCRIDDDCADDDFCEYDPGTCAGPGVCAPRPLECAPPLEPVCDCDGRDQADACLAHQEGISIRNGGACPALGADECLSDADCSQLPERCVKPDGQCGGVGQCRVVGVDCSADVDPVCGCDGRTYYSRCSALSRGITVQSYGACEWEMACDTADDCAEREYCVREIGTCGGPGVCRPGPHGCNFSGGGYSCTCDGRSVFTCEALTVDILHEGFCNQ